MTKEKENRKAGGEYCDGLVVAHENPVGLDLLPSVREALPRETATLTIRLLMAGATISWTGDPTNLIWE